MFFFQFLLTQLLGGIKLSEDAEIVLCSSHDSQYCTLWENSGSVKNYWSKACIYPALDSLRKLSWIISYWRLALLFQHSLSAVTQGIYLGGSPSTIYHYFSSFDLSICSKVFGDGPEWNQQGFLTGDPSERECVRRWYFFLKVFKFNYYFLYMGLNNFE